MALDDYGALIQQGMQLVPDLNAQLLRQAQTAELGAQAQAQRVAAAETAQKLSRLQQFQSDIQTYDGSPQAATRLIMKYPEFADHLKQGWDVQDNAKRQADLTTMGQIYSAASNGNWALAKQLAHQRADSEKAAGYSDPQYDAALDVMDKAADGDPQSQKVVLNMIGAHLAAVTGPEHFGTVYGALQGEKTLQPGEVVVDRTGKVTAESPYIVGKDGTIYERDTGAAGTSTTPPAPTNIASDPGANLPPAQSDVAATLTKAGFSAPVVSGFLGNFHIEGGYGGAQGDGGSANGIAQWRGDRVANFEKVIGKPPSEATPAEQAEFVAWEMQHPEEAGMTPAQRDAIMNAKSPAQAAALIDQFYERSSGQHRSLRMAAANQYAEGTAPVTPSAPGAPTAPPGFKVLISGKGPTKRILTPAEAQAKGLPNTQTYQIDDATGDVSPVPNTTGAGGTGGPLSPKALEAATVAYAKTGKMPAGMGGQAVRNQILNNLPTVMDRYGLTPDDVPAIQQSFAADSAAFKQRTGQLSYMHQSLGKLNQHAQDLGALIKAIPLQGNFTPFNWITQGAEGLVSNSTIAQLRGGLPLFEAEVARVMTGNPNSGAGQLSDDARHEFDILHSTQSPAAKIDALNRIMKMTEEAVKATRDETMNLRHKIGGSLSAYAGNEQPPKDQGDGGWITLPSGLKIRKIR